MFTRDRYFNSFRWFWADNGLVKLSVGIFAVVAQLILISLFCTFSRNQWCLISTCLNLVLNCAVLAVSRRIVCLLSQVAVQSCSRVRRISAKIRFQYQISRTASVNACSSASVLDSVTHDCRFERQSMAPPNSVMRNPPVLRRVRGQSPKDALL